MIKVNEGNIHVEGDATTLLAELAYATSEVFEMIVGKDAEKQAELTALLVKAIALNLDNE